MTTNKPHSAVVAAIIALFVAVYLAAAAWIASSVAEHESSAATQAERNRVFQADLHRRIEALEERVQEVEMRPSVITVENPR